MSQMSQTTTAAGAWTPEDRGAARARFHMRAVGKLCYHRGFEIDPNNAAILPEFAKVADQQRAQGHTRLMRMGCTHCGGAMLMGFP